MTAASFTHITSTSSIPLARSASSASTFFPRIPNGLSRTIGMSAAPASAAFFDAASFSV